MKTLISRHRSGVVELVDTQGQVSYSKKLTLDLAQKMSISASVFVRTLDAVTLEVMRANRTKAQVKPKPRLKKLA